MAGVTPAAYTDITNKVYNFSDTKATWGKMTNATGKEWKVVVFVKAWAKDVGERGVSFTYLAFVIKAIGKDLYGGLYAAVVTLPKNDFSAEAWKDAGRRWVVNPIADVLMVVTIVPGIVLPILRDIGVDLHDGNPNLPLFSKKKEVTEDNKASKKELAKRDKLIKALREDVKTVTTEKDRLAGSVVEKDRVIGEKNVEISKLVDEAAGKAEAPDVAKVRKELAAAITKADEAAARVCALETELATEKASLTRVRQAEQELADQMRALQEALDEKDGAIAKLDEAIKEKEAEVQRLTEANAKESEALQAQHKKETEIATAKHAAELKEKEAALADATAKLDAQTERAAAVAEQLDKAGEKDDPAVKALTAKLAEANQELAKAQRDLKSLEAKLNAKHGDETKILNANHKKEVEGLKAQIAKLRQEGATQAQAYETLRASTPGGSSSAASTPGGSSSAASTPGGSSSAASTPAPASASKPVASATPNVPAGGKIDQKSAVDARKEAANKAAQERLAKLAAKGDTPEAKEEIANRLAAQRALPGHGGSPVGKK